MYQISMALPFAPVVGMEIRFGDYDQKVERVLWCPGEERWNGEREWAFECQVSRLQLDESAGETEEAFAKRIEGKPNYWQPVCAQDKNWWRLP
jgi:hypothetical protein